MKKRTLVQAAIGLLSMTAVAAAQPAWPTRTVTLVVPWAPGGSQDALGRVIAAPLSAELGQQVVVDNRAGATGTIGSATVARARPDGYTLLMGSTSTYAMAPHLVQVPYDNDRAFAPVGHIAAMPILMLVPAALPVRDVAGFIALARQPNARLSYASSGTGSSTHLATEMFLQMAGIEVPDVAYRGGGPAVQGMLTGETQMTFQTAATVLGLMRSGDLRALAVATRDRIPFTPDLPTFAEAGFPNFEVVENIALLAPAGTPAPILSRLNQAMERVMATAEVRQRLNDLAIIPGVRSPDAFTPAAAAESATWRELIRARNIRVQ
ncbi:Bug family tripartite tricarboxylate transporter substrate binding protein [Falsiroseomonas algicola]|nr:tripartite tricarboxylate transporter substrate binding protein [Falsiroseomonas algicola]